MSSLVYSSEAGQLYSHVLSLPSGKIHFLSPFSDLSPRTIRETVVWRKPVGVIIHGANVKSQNTQHWNPLYDVFLKYLIPVIVDNYGHGLSSPARKGRKERMRHHLEGLQKLIEYIIRHSAQKSGHSKNQQQLQSETRFLVIGRSYGGKLALLLSQRLPVIKGLLLIAPAIASLDPSIRFSLPISCLHAIEDPVISPLVLVNLARQCSNFHVTLIGKDLPTELKTLSPAFYSTDKAVRSHAPELVVPSLFESILAQLVNQLYSKE